jgi:hypothetical protein
MGPAPATDVSGNLRWPSSHAAGTANFRANCLLLDGSRRSTISNLGRIEAMHVGGNVV